MTTFAALPRRHKPGGPLTERQAYVHRWVVNYCRKHGSPPTLREVMTAMCFRSPNATVTYFRALQRRGFMREDGAIGTSNRWIPITPGVCLHCGQPLPKKD